MDGHLSTCVPGADGRGPRPLRILLSAYACEPGKGSEPGIGWRWALNLARRGHDVWVLTRANNREAIEAARPQEQAPSLRFVYYDLPSWARRWKRGGRGVRLYYVLWQWGAYRLARRLHREARFHIAHHITFGVFRHPSFMAFLDIPFVFGPVGGGEQAPRPLRRTFPLRGYLLDLARNAANWAVRFDPLMAATYRRAAITLCKTRETLRRIPARYQDKCLVHVEVGIDIPQPGWAERRRRAHEGLRVLYVGRMLYWKGVHLGLRAFARFRESHPDTRFTLIGSGCDEAWLRHQAEELGLAQAVHWVPWLEHSAVMRAYHRHDVFLFPSLHDSSGNAVLEALAHGLPVVCLNLGGPAVLVDASCGFRIEPGPAEDVVAGLAAALAALADNPVLSEAMSRAAVERARRQFSWSRQTARMERLYSALAAEELRERVACRTVR
ncbi:glycosyltransferase family 4 protein [Pelomicrobium sp.]|jgi:glycosyltransferase involved in cell wall biosynthesis|uniref:glycosyltransferase family 4 protein n=1 Tax=Pelomicrobium sp. TaxID=2815319 RepID=UPI002FDCDE01